MDYRDTASNGIKDTTSANGRHQDTHITTAPTLGCCFSFEDISETESTVLSKAPSTFIEATVWEEERKTRNAKDRLHFLPLQPSNAFDKAYIKKYVKPMRSLVATKLKRDLQTNPQTSSNGIVVLVIVATLFHQMVQKCTETDLVEEQEATSIQILQAMRQLMLRICFLWPTARGYVQDQVAKVLLSATFTKALFQDYMTDEKQNLASRAVLSYPMVFAVVMKHPPTASDSLLLPKLLLIHYQNIYFLHAVREYTELNPDLGIVNGELKATSMVADTIREKLLFQYLCKQLQLFCIYSLLISLSAQGEAATAGEREKVGAYCKRVKRLTSWREFASLLFGFPTRESGDKIDPLVKSMLFPRHSFGEGAKTKADTKCGNIFHIHVILSATMDLHVPQNTSTTQLLTLIDKYDLLHQDYALLCGSNLSTRCELLVATGRETRLRSKYQEHKAEVARLELELSTRAGEADRLQRIVETLQEQLDSMLQEEKRKEQSSTGEVNSSVQTSEPVAVVRRSSVSVTPLQASPTCWQAFKHLFQNCFQADQQRMPLPKDIDRSDESHLPSEEVEHLTRQFDVEKVKSLALELEVEQLKKHLSLLQSKAAEMATNGRKLGSSTDETKTKEPGSNQASESTSVTLT